MKKFTLLLTAACLFLLYGCAPAAVSHADSSSASTAAESLYVPMSIASARVEEAGSFVQVEGVVVQITYGADNSPCGIYLADNTNSILVYGPSLAAQVQIGNRLCLQATKSFHIPEAQSHYARQFGYDGSCQLENPTLLSNDGRTDNAYDHSWIQERSIRELMATPFSENITTSIFKVLTLIELREDGCYFLDLDGATGSCAYTQCRGEDFQWLQEYDGKLCQLYLSVINAQATEAGCTYRFQPIVILEADITFDPARVPAHVIEFYALPQFQMSYTDDPALELITAVSSELLRFTDAKLAYHSSDDTVLDIRLVDGVLRLHTVRPGTATITVIAQYKEFAVSQAIEITVTDSAEAKNGNIDEPAVQNLSADA